MLTVKYALEIRSKGKKEVSIQKRQFQRTLVLLNIS